MMSLTGPQHRVGMLREISKARKEKEIDKRSMLQHLTMPRRLLPLASRVGRQESHPTAEPAEAIWRTLPLPFVALTASQSKAQEINPIDPYPFSYTQCSALRYRSIISLIK